MSRILVTGAGGFIGSNLVRVLLDRGHEVAIIVRPATNLMRLGDFADRVTTVIGDIGEANVVSNLPWTPDSCAHLAWYADPRTYLVSRENVRSLTASLELLFSLIAIGCSHFVITGSCAEYRPISRPLSEDDDVDPATLYAATKLSMFITAKQVIEQAGAGLAWARLFYLYGPNEDRHRLIPAAINSLLVGREFPASSGSQVRDYLHLSDAAEALCGLIESRATGAINVCSGVPVTVHQLLEEIGHQIGRPELIHFGELSPRKAWDPAYVVGENIRLRELIRWRPKYDLATGLDHVIDWWRSNSSGAAPG